MQHECSGGKNTIKAKDRKLANSNTVWLWTGSVQKD